VKDRSDAESNSYEDPVDEVDELNSCTDYAGEEDVQSVNYDNDIGAEPIDTIIKFNSLQGDVVLDNVSDRSSRLEASTRPHNVEDMVVKKHYIESQLKDGASMDTKKQEHRYFRQMGHDHLWSKVKFINSRENIPSNGAMAKYMYKLCNAQKLEQQKFWLKYSPELRGLIVSKRAQVCKSIGERFKTK